MKLKGTKYADLQVTEKAGRGQAIGGVSRALAAAATIGAARSTNPRRCASHARKHKLPLAEFEHRRNKAFFEARGMAKYVAEPLGFVVEPGFQMSLQERRAMARSTTSRSAITRTSSRRASWKISPNSVTLEHTRRSCTTSTCMP